MTSTATEQPTSTPTSAAPKRAPAKRQSAATRRTAASAKSAPAKTGKTVTSAPAKTKTVKPAGPSERQLKQEIAQFALTAAVNAFAKLPRKTIDGVTFVTVNRQQVPEPVALYAMKQTFGYVPASVWDERLGVRDVGRLGAAGR